MSFWQHPHSPPSPFPQEIASRYQLVPLYTAPKLVLQTNGRYALAVYIHDFAAMPGGWYLPSDYQTIGEDQELAIQTWADIPGATDTPFWKSPDVFPEGISSPLGKALFGPVCLAVGIDGRYGLARYMSDGLVDTGEWYPYHPESNQPNPTALQITLWAYIPDPMAFLHDYLGVTKQCESTPTTQTDHGSEQRESPERDASS